MNIQLIAEAIIYKKHGWEVAKQFEITWYNRGVVTFGEQNEIALNHIYEILSELIESDLLDQNAIDELEEYLDKMDDAMDYLTK